MTPVPNILLVDDDEEDAGHSLAQAIGASGRVIYRHPRDVVIEDLEKSDLLLVDHELRDWPERDHAAVSLRPRNGLALAGILRQHLNAFGGDHVRAVALFTAQVQDLSGPLPQEVRGHALARLHDLEWVFEKQSPTAAREIVSLAHAVSRLPRDWPSDPDEAIGALQGLLALTSESVFADSGWEDVLACHPPLYELSEASHTIALLRWLAHRILPYPTFLLDHYHLARALSLEPTALLEALESPALTEWLGPAMYEGILADFIGARWWRAGVDQCVWASSDGDIGTSQLTQFVSELVGTDLKPAPDDPVVVVSERYGSVGLVSALNAVRLRPDDWPAFADTAWGAVELVSAHPRLRALTIPDDRGRIGM